MDVSLPKNETLEIEFKSDKDKLSDNDLIDATGNGFWNVSYLNSYSGRNYECCKISKSIEMVFTQNLHETCTRASFVQCYKRCFKFVELKKLRPGNPDVGERGVR